jgi:serine phosphatase RsbU (regulator of sigma subunit)
VIEAESGSGEAFGNARFSELARCEDLNGILDRVGRFQASHEAQDDCTLVEISYSGVAGK